MTLEDAIVEARRLDESRRASGFDQTALDEAARKGFANGAFEDLAEDVPAVVEEFYPDTDALPEHKSDVRAEPSSLRRRLEEKVARTGNG